MHMGANDMRAARSAEEVFHDHLRHRQHGDLDADLHNYAPDVVILTGHGTYKGHDGVRESGDLLKTRLPNAAYDYQTTLVSGEMAFLEWTAESGEVRAEDGVDCFLIRDGLIRVQTIHYRVVHEGEI